MLQEVAEGSENTDIVLHEPLLAEEEPLPTPPESPLMNELVSLMPGSSPGRTPSPSPGFISKEGPKFLSPGNWNDDKSARGAGSRGSSKPNSRPTTPSTSASAPEDGGAPSSHGLSRTPSCHSNKMEQGSDLEIKPLQKFDSEPKAPDIPPAAAAPVRNSLIAPDEEEAPHPASKVSSKAVTPEPKPSKVKTNRAPSVHERETSVSESKVESREVSRPSSRAETKPLLKRQPSPAPSPRPTPKLEPKVVPKKAEAKAAVAKPASKVEPKAEVRQKVMVSSPSNEVATDSLELEVRR